MRTVNWILVCLTLMSGLIAKDIESGMQGFIREEWAEKNFQTLLQWERDGIFPHIYANSAGPDWYVREKLRRRITVHPARIVTPEEFRDPEYRKRIGR